ncbi:MAG: sugar transferase [Bacteroidia bacterium]|nr:sugar transferase [Bacteroidota bacterium]MBK9425627.1 sugar transferase [Bacteroidota bacterium]MBP9081894.1 sugar transferase [Bacteroidia bacterium]
MVKRIFDLILAAIFLILLAPLFIFIAIRIKLDSKGSVFYKQVRVGLNGKDFGIYKFRTMFVGSDKKGLLTVGGNDARITRPGLFLRKYKLDELPQLINVFFGDMSIVGPRPEVRKYVDLYSKEQLQVLSVKPGITDYASIEYSKENEILANATDPEATYIHEIMPAKLALNQKYIREQSFFTDLKIILQTLVKIVS